MSRWWTVLLLVALLGSAAGAAVLALDARHLPVREVRVTGELRYLPRAEVARRLSALQGRSFLTLDLGEVRTRIADSPWVAHVAVRRAWPDTLLVEVTERRAVARWAGGGLVDAGGRLFHPERGPERGPLPGGLPELAGPEGTEEEVLAGYRRYSALLAPAAVTLRRVVLERRRAWRLETDDGIELIVGRTEPEAALRRFAAVAAVLRGGARAPGRVDLRYPNGLAVRWKQRPPPSGESD